MEKFLIGLDQQILEALAIGQDFNPPKPKNIKQILFCGMGGSAIGGDALRILIDEDANLHFKVNRAGEIPSWLDSRTLVILSSYSGNSVEILRMMKDLFAAKAQMLMVSAGGKLSEIAKQKKIPWLRVPGGMMPRCAIGYMTFCLFPVFKKWGWVNYSDQDLREVAFVVKKTSRKQAKDLARQLHNCSVHFYGGSGFAAPLMTRWRAQFAENSKMLASQHLIPEMFHNEIEGWKFPREIIRKSAAVFFLDEEDPKWLRGKTKAAEKIIKKAGAKVIEVKSRGKSFVARLFSLIALGDWVSYELARLNHVDPLGIPSIEAIKKTK